MPVKKMTPEVCSPTDAGTKPRHILSRKSRRLKRRVRNSVLLGSFLAATVLMFLTAFLAERWGFKTLLIFIPCVAWFVAFGAANEGWLNRRAR